MAADPIELAAARAEGVAAERARVSAIFAIAQSAIGGGRNQADFRVRSEIDCLREAIRDVNAGTELDHKFYIRWAEIARNERYSADYAADEEITAEATIGVSGTSFAPEDSGSVASALRLPPPSPEVVAVNQRISGGRR